MGKLWGVVQKKSATLNLCIHALRILLLTTWERQYFGLAVGKLHGFSQRAEKELGVALRDESTGTNMCSVRSPLQGRGQEAQEMGEVFIYFLPEISKVLK